MPLRYCCAFFRSVSERRELEAFRMASAIARASGLVGLALGGLAVPAWGQAIPDTTVSGLTREEVTREPPPSVPPTIGQRVTVEGDIERAPCPLAAPEFANLKVTLQSVDFGDLKGISSDLLRPSWGTLVGQEIPIARVCDIRDSAATALRRAGYLAAVQVPPQRIENGIIKFDVLLARLVDFQVRGNAGRSEKLIAGYLSAIKEQPVFNIIEAERYLLLARDIPGYDVRLTLRPAGSGRGEVIGEVLVAYTPLEVDSNFQNYGSKDVGRFGGLLQARYNGLLGIGDRTTLGVYSTAQTSEQQVLIAGQEFRVGREGLVLAGDFTYAWTRPSLDPGTNLKSRTLVGSIEARYPLRRSQSENIFVAGGFDLVNQRARLDTLPVSRDRLRVLYARISGDTIDPDSIASLNGYSAAEPRWRLGGTVELRHGLSVFNASPGCGPNNIRCVAGVTPPTRTEGDPTAFVARYSGYAEFRPTPLIAFSLSPRVQYASRPLFSYEEFSAGNFTVGRGYDPGVLTGDSGVGVSSEVRYGSLVPRSIRDLAVQGYTFLDAAFTWNKDRSAPPGDPQKLYSAGGGLRFAYGDRVRLDLAAAFPLKRAGLQTERADMRVLANLTIKLLPWIGR
jgi:hemolysin activation/secretion protein